ncbi:DUF5067 domain-containing protein [Paucilactobacillus suebicus]|uniref:DUF5067 domain-containing protein n=1 Tax=Paucilactobacillus suebicus DSM 5007 = KCTC 3549 TaxID=1423807 RepID=A0A0R1VV36_9LACO|nr:DUF5067 domain-containing protein [Paucilactobacillus suebicus]KRM09293.1 hypothetical protein FD16_GL001852 [Paucilactobacillus suebicus DSM 5007 = KCTC 3549]
MKKIMMVGISLIALLSLTACGTSSSGKNRSSSNIKSASNKNSFVFKSGTLKTPDETIKIINVSTTTPSLTDKNSDGHVAVIKYNFTNKTNHKVEPEAAFLDRFNVDQVYGNKSNSLSVTEVSANDQFDNLHQTAMKKVVKNKTVHCVALYDLTKPNFNTLKIVANNAEQNAIGHKNYKLKYNESTGESSSATQTSSSSSSSTNTTSANVTNKSSNTSQQADPTNPDTWNLPYKGYSSYNAYCEANNGDPNVQAQTASMQNQWAIQNGYENPDGTDTAKGRAADSEVNSNADPNDAGDPNDGSY